MTAGPTDAGKVPVLDEDGKIDTSMLPPAGSGDMLRSTYDPDFDGKVTSAQTADSVAWSGVTGKPSTFPPDSHSHVLASITDAGTLAGKNAIQVSDIDPESATIGQVLTADGAGGTMFDDVPGLSNLSGAATVDTTITTANTWYAPAGCSLNLDAGTWLVYGRTVVGRTATTAVRYTARLRNVTDNTTLDEAEQHYPSQNPHYVTLPLVAIVTLGVTKTVRLEATANQNSCMIKANPATNQTGTNQATRIVAIKIG